MTADAGRAAADKAEIREILSEYCFRMDDGDFTGVAGLFTEDGEWQTNYAAAKGRQEIAELLDRINPERGTGPFRKHIVANSVITLTGDSARSRASYLVLMAVDGRPAPIVVGTYDDQSGQGRGHGIVAHRQAAARARDRRERSRLAPAGPVLTHFR